MLKLMKYEFRKGRTSLIVMLLVALGLLGLSFVGKLLKDNALLIIGTVLLGFYALAAYIYVLVRGSNAYAGELKNKTGYLLLMTPHSTLAVLVSKILYTLLAAVMMMVVSIAALYVSGTMLTARMGAYVNLFEAFKAEMLQAGINLDGYFLAGALILIEVLVSVLSLVSMSYLSVTLAATVLQEGRAREFVSGLFMLAMIVVSFYVSNKLSGDFIEYRTFRAVIQASLPSLALHLGITCACTVGSALLLDRKVSL